MTKFITVHTPSVYKKYIGCVPSYEADYDNCKEVVINADNIVCFNNEGIELDTGAKIRTKETLEELKELLQ